MILQIKLFPKVVNDKKALVIGHSFVKSMDDFWRRKYSTCPVAALEKMLLKS